MTARIENQGNSHSKKNICAKDGSHISNAKWKKINTVYVDPEDGKGKGDVCWNAFSPQRADGISQLSSQSQSSFSDNLSQTSPSVVIGAIHNKRPVPAKRQKRGKGFIRHGSKEELLKSYANASINQKPCKKKKTDSSPCAEEDLSANKPLEESSSPDFPEDGLDGDLFEASQAFEQEYHPVSKIKETPKRISLRTSTRHKLPINEKHTMKSITKHNSSGETVSSETLSEQFLRFSTGEDSCVGMKKGNSMEGFDDGDDELFSQVPLP